MSSTTAETRPDGENKKGIRDKLPLPSGRRLSVLRGSETGDWALKNFARRVKELEHALGGNAKGSVAGMLAELKKDITAANGHFATVIDDWSCVSETVDLMVKWYREAYEGVIPDTPMQALGELLYGLQAFVNSGEGTEAVTQLKQAQHMAASRYMALTSKAEWPRRPAAKKSPKGKTYRQYIREAWQQKPHGTKRQIYQLALKNSGSAEKEFLSWETVRKHFKKIVPSWKQSHGKGGQKP